MNHPYITLGQGKLPRDTRERSLFTAGGGGANRGAKNIVQPKWGG